MRTIAMVGRSELRRRRGGVIAVGLTLALGLGAALGAFIAAHRTDRAYPDHVVRARMADLVINPSLTSSDSDAVIRALPHVRDVSTYALMYAGYLDPGRRYTLGDVLADNQGNLYASADGRFLDTDRLIVDEGERPVGPREVFVTDGNRDDLSKRLGHRIRIGERLPISFLWSGSDVEATDETLRQVVRPIGTERLRISGFGRLADAVLDDPVFPHAELIVSPDVARRYMCPPATIPATTDRDRLLRAIYPTDCSVLYRYYALDLDDPARVAEVARAAQHRLSELNDGLAQRIGTTAPEVAYYPVMTTRRDDDARVRHSIRPTVVALQIFGWVALVASLTVLALAAARLMRDSRASDDVLRALGASRWTRVGAQVLPAGVGAIVGLGAAIGVGILLSPVGPVGEVSRVAPGWSLVAPASVVVPFTIAALATLAVVLAVAGLLTTRTRGDARRGRRRTDALRRSLPPEVADGVTTAFASGRAALVPGAASVAIGVVVAAAVFWANLGAVVEHPPRYGWPWQVGVLTGVGYGDTRTDAVRATLANRSGVRAWDWLAIASGTVAGKPVALLYGAHALDLPVVAGRAPGDPARPSSVGRPRLGSGS